ncbi:DNA/RNA non-specific endonuclease [Butyrivibrio sp.]|uniref:DNA/RNA non-specific endonuclease n=1 Tax=Butyrivibrio sp. TaxID=28121 RepID=UPI0025C53665|nr:DNA/RNA non-specific endonuclease [Butyrivibrio sp.]
MREKRTATSTYALIIAFELLICTVFSLNLSAIQVEAAESAASFAGSASVAINNNVPEFTADEITTDSYESYGNFDSLGRCTAAMACVGKDIMPTEERGSIGSVKPTGWNQNKYPGIVNSEPPYLYNRCHLIGYQLTGENANEKNLITGTRYFNIEGMLPYENRVAGYVESTGNHVMYRVTPIFSGNNLLCDGVKMEAYSVEDGGSGVSFNVFCYNVQPGVLINYADGSNQLDEGFVITSNETEQEITKSSPVQTETAVEAQSEQADQPPQSASYIANKNTKKFHYPSCSSVSDMKEKNKLYYEGSRDDLINQGYVPCKKCNP